MKAVVFRPRAAADLEAILRYVAKRSGSRSTAAQYVDEIIQHISGYARLPTGLGCRRPDLGPDLRTFAHGRYLVVFRQFDESLLVYRVVHMARRIERMRFDEEQAPYRSEAA